jgi:integrase
LYFLAAIIFTHFSLCPFYISTKCRETVFNFFISTVDMENIADFTLSLCRECRNNKRRTTAEICRCDTISAKTFHSIRHTVVSLTRLDASFTPDMVRDAVGHTSEQVEQRYFHGDMTSRKSVYSSLASTIKTVADMPVYDQKNA